MRAVYNHFCSVKFPGVNSPYVVAWYDAQQLIGISLIQCSKRFLGKPETSD